MADTRFPVNPAYRNERGEEHLRLLSSSVNGILRGEANNHFRVELAVDAEQTRVDDPTARLGSIGQSTPQNGAAALEAALWIEVFDGYFLIHHSNSTLERVVGVTLHG